MTESVPIPTDRHLFCFGCGYTATRLAQRLLSAGARVSGTSRSEDGADRLRSLGIKGHIFDGARPLAKDAFAGVTDVLVSIPPGEDGEDGVLSLHGATLETLSGLRWTALLSSTGVYGDTGGAWIDESAPLRPMSDRGRRRVAAERRWLAWGESTGRTVQLFRLPGIYGPGRSVFARLRAGAARRIVKPGQVFNRMHVDDIVTALLLGIQRPDAGPVFHLADEHPAPADEVLTHAAALLDLPPPPAVAFEDAALSPMAREFYAECKRLRNDRMKQELGLELAYPSYREGLVATLAEEQDLA